MIRYTDSLDGLAPEHLGGFFDGWPKHPSPETHLALLRRSQHVVLAVDVTTTRVVGFVTAISDGLLSAYIPLLEVLPSHRGQGIGTELMRRILVKLAGLYMVDLLCDPPLQPFYARVGMVPATGMMLRRRDQQSGRAAEAEG